MHFLVKSSEGQIGCDVTVEDNGDLRVSCRVPVSYVVIPARTFEAYRGTLDAHYVGDITIGGDDGDSPTRSSWFPSRMWTP